MREEEVSLLEIKFEANEKTPEKNKGMDSRERIK